MDKQEKEITLKNDLDWFLSDEFKELRQGFEPTDNSEFIKEYCKKYNICSEEKTPYVILQNKDKNQLSNMNIVVTNV